MHTRSLTAPQVMWITSFKRPVCSQGSMTPHECVCVALSPNSVDAVCPQKQRLLDFQVISGKRKKVEKVNWVNSLRHADTDWCWCHSPVIITCFVIGETVWRVMFRTSASGYLIIWLFPQLNSSNLPDLWSSCRCRFAWCCICDGTSNLMSGGPVLCWSVYDMGYILRCLCTFSVIRIVVLQGSLSLCNWTFLKDVSPPPELLKKLNKSSCTKRGRDTWM